MFSIKEKFQSNPLLYYALSICATWAGIGSLMNGVAMTQTYGIIPSAIWVFGNTAACILFGYLAFKIPKLREVFNSKIMLWICGLMCVFQAWHAGSFRQPSAATFLSEEGLLPPDSTPIRCNALYLAGKACEKEYEQMLVPLLFFSSGINLLYGRCPFGLAFVF